MIFFRFIIVICLFWLPKIAFGQTEELKFISKKEREEIRKSLIRIFNDKEIDRNDIYQLNVIGHELAKLEGLQKEARQCYEMAADASRIKLKKDDLLYAISVMNLGYFYNSEKLYTQSESMYYQALDLFKNNLTKKKESSYILCLVQLSDLLVSQNKYDKAVPLYLEALEINKKLEGYYHISTGAILEKIGKTYQRKFDMDNAEEHFLEAHKIVKYIREESHSDYLASLDNLAIFYRDIGNYEKVKVIYTEILEINKRKFGEKHLSYASNLISYAINYLNMNVYWRAEPILLEATSILKKTKLENNPEYFRGLNALAGLYQKQGKFDQSEEFFKRSLNLIKQNLGEDHPDYITSLKGLGSFYTFLGKYEKSLPLLQEVLRLVKKNIGEDKSEFASGLINLAAIYTSLKKYDKAEMMYSRGVSLTKKLYGNFHPSYALGLMNFASYYTSIGKYNKALQLYDDSKKIFEKTKGINNDDYARLIEALSIVYMKKNDTITMAKYLRQVIDYKTQYHYDNLNTVIGSSHQSTALMMEIHKQALIYFFGKSAFQNLPKAMYKQFNASKGVQLFAKMELNKSFASDEKNIKELFKRLNILRAKKSDLSNSPRNSQKALLALIKEEATLEIEISKRSTSYNLNFVPQEFEDVQSKLRDEEVFIDFYSVDSIIYTVLISSTGAPVWKFIYNKKLLASLNSDTLTGRIDFSTYSSSGIYNLIIQPFAELLVNKKTIYYSPDGLVHNIAFHAIKNKHAKSLDELYNLKRISSSRSLYKKESEVDGNVVLFGGIDYGDISTKSKQKVTDWALDLLKEEMTKRGGSESWSELPGSLAEVNELSQALSSKKTTLYKGEDATETTFNKLSGHSPEILFISTHGYYFPPKEKLKNTWNNRMGIKSDDAPQFMIDPMQRSGLIFAGANISLNNKASVPSNNGIVTASEVASMDLTKTKMVVLSACQTALGDVKNGEGVLGLQRGFKQAGVEYILASLWEIPDKDTKELMISFFKHLEQTKQPYEAMKLARADMKALGKTTYQYQGFVVIR